MKNLSNVMFILLILLLIVLVIKLYLDTNLKLSLDTNLDTSLDTSLDTDYNFKELLIKLKNDTDNKINIAVEEGFTEGFQSMNISTNYDSNPNNLNDSNLKNNDTIVSYINKNNVVKLMLFYKMQCSYSQDFMPVWYRIVNNLPNDVKYEEIECDREPKKAIENNITTVPTLIMLINNEKKIYVGNRSYNDIARFMKYNGINLIERTFEKFDSTGYANETQTKIRQSPNCPAVTFDKQADLQADKYMYQIFNEDGQYGYATGSNKYDSTFSPFNAAYSAVDSYLSSLPDPKDNTKNSYKNVNECASLYANQIRSFGLCDKEQLDKILKYQENVKTGSGKIRFDGTDYNTNTNVVNAIKKACLL